MYVHKLFEIFLQIIDLLYMLCQSYVVSLTPCLALSINLVLIDNIFSKPWDWNSSLISGLNTLCLYEFLYIHQCVISASPSGPFIILGYEFQSNVVIEDREYTGSHMGGKPWKAGKFSLTLRLSLWSEHLGLQEGEVSECHYSSHFSSCFVLQISEFR